MPKPFKLAKHQQYASEMMENSYQLAIFYEAGTGKTMCVLDFLYLMFKEYIKTRGKSGLKNALVICPASIVSSWESSIDKMLQFEGYTAHGVKEMHNLITIRSYQKTYQRVETQIKHRDGTIEKKKVLKIRPDILHEWGAIIIDESQGLGSHDSTQTKIALQMSYLTERRYILSGTPVSGGGGGEDFKKLYGQLKFLDPDLWGSYKEFCAELVTGYDYFNKPCRYEVKKCRELMQNYGIVARLDACYDMPDSMDIPINVEISQKAIPVYRDILAGRVDTYNMEMKSGGSRYIKLLEIVSGFLKTEDPEPIEIPVTKPEALESVLDSTDDKVVVFCNFRHSIDVCEQICKKYGSTVVYDGRSARDTWRDFQYGDAKYLICQYQSGGVGIDLFASHTMVFYEPTVSSLLLEQSKARIRRKGQVHKCLYYWISTQGTIEQKAMDTVRSGVDVTREMLDEWAKKKEIADNF